MNGLLLLLMSQSDLTHCICVPVLVPLAMDLLNGISGGSLEQKKITMAFSVHNMQSGRMET